MKATLTSSTVDASVQTDLSHQPTAPAVTYITDTELGHSINEIRSYQIRHLFTSDGTDGF